MTDDTPLPFDLPSVRRKKLTVDFEGGNQSSNGGALLLREAERDVGVCRRLDATCRWTFIGPAVTSLARSGAQRGGPIGSVS